MHVVLLQGRQQEQFPQAQAPGGKSDANGSYRVIVHDVSYPSLHFLERAKMCPGKHGPGERHAVLRGFQQDIQESSLYLQAVSVEWVFDQSSNQIRCEKV